MKLVIAVIHDRDIRDTSDALLRAGFKFTRIASTGGFLRDGNVTLLIGCEADEYDGLLEIIRAASRCRDRWIHWRAGESASRRRRRLRARCRSLRADLTCNPSSRSPTASRPD